MLGALSDRGSPEPQQPRVQERAIACCLTFDRMRCGSGEPRSFRFRHHALPCAWLHEAPLGKLFDQIGSKLQGVFGNEALGDEMATIAGLCCY